MFCKNPFPIILKGWLQKPMRNVLEWLEATEARTPDARAVADETDALTFAQLGDAARARATWLVERGARPRQAIALYLEKSPAALSWMLAGVYAGCFYSVIDVRQPPARVLSILDSLQPAAIITDRANEDAIGQILADNEGYLGILACLEDVDAPAPDDEALAQVRAQATDVDPLYVNFTSGSTGTPKGVVVSHRSVIDFIPVFTSTFGIDGSDILANQAPFDFDVSVKDIYSCLSTGAQMQLVPRPFFTQPARLMDYLADNQVTTLVWAVSAMCFVSVMNAFDYRTPATIRRVLFSGEVMPPKQLARWRKHLPQATYVNLYGPTEVTCNCTYHVLDRDYSKDEVIPIGRPFDNERVFLLDDDGREVTQPGATGEICVSGTALALGYLGDAQRTAAAFTQNPLNTRWRETIYHTGDLAHYDDAMNLVYETRKDTQIKHLGQRIELGDIEACALRADDMEQAACLYDHKRSKLVLFYVGALAHDDLVAHLRSALPQYMVPAQVRDLEVMPLNKNGKIDRNALRQLANITAS